MKSLETDVSLPSQTALGKTASSRRSADLFFGHSLKFRLGVAIFALTLIAGILGVILAAQAYNVRNQLESTIGGVRLLYSQVAEGDHQGAQQSLGKMQEATSGARSTTSGILWKAASCLPKVGSNFSAVAEVAVSADDVVSGSLRPLISIYESVDSASFAPQNGHIDFTQIKKATPKILSAETTLRLSFERLSAIDQSRLMTKIAEPINDATNQIRVAAEQLQIASSLTQVVPEMLGAEEQRNLLILVQNTAEARATGGIPGALAVLRTDKGEISLGEQGSASALGTFVPSLEVDTEQLGIYTERLGTQMQNVNLTPDFPTAANTAKRMWELRHSDQQIDGVLALDPVVLSHLLRATGPVNLNDPEILRFIQDTSLPSALTDQNVVSTLLSDVYREIEDPKIQDAYFAAVAERIFSSFTKGDVDSTLLFKALLTSVQEDRLYMWSSHDGEQNIVASTPLAGSVGGSTGDGPDFGVYFNDGTGAKMDYYVTRSVQLTQACPVEDYGDSTVSVTATNNAPEDAASSLPAYVTGGGGFGVEAGRIRTNYVFYGPSQSFVETASIDGQPVPLSSGKHGQRPVGTVPLELGPGESATIDMVFSNVRQNSKPRLRVTPTIQSPEQVVRPLEREACS